jgi:hypothetical protein
MYEFIGDLVCDDPAFPFCVEVKNNESWEMGQLLTSKSPPILKWWEQATVQATKSEKYPILVILKNRSQPLVVANATFFFAVTRKAKIPFLTLTLPDHEVLYIFKLDDVVSHTKVRA